MDNDDDGNDDDDDDDGGGDAAVVVADDDDDGHDDHDVHRNKPKHARACLGTDQMPQLGQQACLTRVHPHCIVLAMERH